MSEEFLAPDDFKRIGEEITCEELEKINGHPLGDSEKEMVEINFEQIKGKDPLLEDQELIKGKDDPGEMYRSISDVISESLLKETPEKDRYYLHKSTEFRQRKDGLFKGGRTCGEVMVKRVLDENGEWKTKKGWGKYISLNEFQYWFIRKDNEQREYRKLNAGETFSAPKSMENKERKKEMMLKAKKSFN